MGRDKAFIGPPDDPLVRRIASVLGEAGAGGVVVVGGDGDRIAALGLDWMADEVSGSGPLGGIATAARAHRGRPLVVAACDLPHLGAAAVERLVDHVPDAGAAAVYVDRNDRIQWSLVALGADVAMTAVSRFDGGDRAVHVAIGDRVTVLRPRDWREIADADEPDDLPPDLRG
jgi:molybdopterin-guanine dinucleotide biosynthesis protein A